MNDKVEEKFRQMFAPEDVPQVVVEAFERTNFLANRIDAGLMRPTDLALIAGAALVGVKQSTIAKKKPLDMIDTTERTENALGKRFTEAEEQSIADSLPALPQETAVEPAEPIDDSVEPTDNAPAPTGPTGQMDAPTKPDAKRRRLAATKMLQLTGKELRTHAIDNYGWTPPTSYDKRQVVAVLQNLPPKGT